MDDTSRQKNLTPTFIGLALALLASPVFIATYRAITGENRSNWQVLGREMGVFLLMAMLLWIVKRWEVLPLTSIGLRVNMLGKSLQRGLWLAAIVLVATIGLYLGLRGVGVHLGEEHINAFHPSLLVVTVVMLRAGITEEIFYRGFAIERLQSLTGSKHIAALVPLAAFAVAHYRQGMGGIVAAFVLGGIFTWFYMKYRDLLASMTAHFLGDFVLNVVMPLVSGG
jgi:membrane protease YdiL (CAAX protease family)